VSNPIDLRVDRSLQFVTRLKQTAADFVKREEQLGRELRERGFALKRQQEQAREASEAQSAAQLSKTEARLEEHEQRIRSIHQARGARIHRMYTSGVRDSLQESQRKRERWLGDLQMRHLQTERELPVKLKAEENEYSEFSGALAEQRRALGSLDNQARRGFGGFSSLTRLLRYDTANEGEQPTDERTRDVQFAELQQQVLGISVQMAAFRRLPIPRIFSYLPLPILGLIVAVAAFGLWWGFGSGAMGWKVAGGFLGASALIIAILYRIGLSQARLTATTIASDLRKAAQLHDTCAAAAVAEYQGKYQAIKDDYQRVCSELQEKWDQADELEIDAVRGARQKMESQVPRALARNEKLLRRKLEKFESTQTADLARCKAEIAERQRQLEVTRQAETEALAAEEKHRWATLASEWKAALAEIHAGIDAMTAAANRPFATWSRDVAESWQPAKEFIGAARFGQLQLDLGQGPLPKLLPAPESKTVTLPLALSFPDQGSLLFETSDSGDGSVIGTLNHIILRLLTTMPPGKISITIIDPVGLGQNFAGLMHLSDYEESIINRRIWTQRDQIEERLEELNEHIEKVIQMYLRNEFATITDYNEQAGSVAEKYHFLVIADFPANFGETAAKRLQSIAISGPRCGVFTLVHWDRRQPQPDGFVSDELRKNAVCIQREGSALALSAEDARGTTLLLDSPPDADLAGELVHKIGKGSVDSNRVELPFDRVTPTPEEMWTNETTHELKVAIGRTGATKLQYLAIGKGTRQHALFAGKTGSGKSTLFHVIITNLSLACSPEQVEFYLIDFKKGVEFKCYASKHLPHARVVAIESDREFGLSVLQRVDEELKRRGDMFRKLGVQDVAGYRKAGGTEPVPRSLLIIDEFQEFFVEDDEIAQNASVLFDRIVRQGRAFGIHVLLGSQTLGGAYSLARATLGQMVIRVALQCNEADAYLIMDENNAAPRLLSRPGEGIYNDAAGALEGNSPFQVVWLGDEERDRWLDQVQVLAKKHGDKHTGPIVFEGNAPADLTENHLLERALINHPKSAPTGARCWLGAPNSIKGPTEAVFHRQSGNHLLIVGQRDEAALAIIGVSMISLAAQYPVGAAKFYLFHSSVPGSADAQFLERIAAAIPHGVTVVHGNEVADQMNEISEEQKSRSADQTADAPAVFVFIHGLHKFKKLRHEDEFDFSMSGESTTNPGAQLNTLICEGSSLGLHLIASIDTFNNVNRHLSRKALSEIEMRVVFQMSANDSASLIDSPKASGLGLHRALLYNEQQGTLETFRPYAIPDADWIKKAGEDLRSKK
jgi:DNA segregation ATPase FtsK/SpoIIIE, S-DNA-T family